LDSWNVAAARDELLARSFEKTLHFFSRKRLLVDGVVNARKPRGESCAGMGVGRIFFQEATMVKFISPASKLKGIIFLLKSL